MAVTSTGTFTFVCKARDCRRRRSERVQFTEVASGICCSKNSAHDSRNTAVVVLSNGPGTDCSWSTNENDATTGPLLNRAISFGSP